MPKLRKLQKNPDEVGYFFRRRMPNKDVRHLGDYGQSAVKPSKADRAAQRRTKQNQRAYAQRNPEPRPQVDDPAWQALRADVLAVGCCAWCKSTSNLTVDHITPLAAGGRSVRANLQCLCNGCNQAKGNLTGVISCPD